MSDLNKSKMPYIALFLLFLALVPLFLITKYAANARAPLHTNQFLSTEASLATHHYEYVFPDGGMYIYDIDNGQRLVKSVNLPTTRGVRGVVASPATRMLYVSYGGDGGVNGNGSLLKFNLLTNAVIWTKDYPFGIDSMAITPDGKKIYMPDGTAQYDGLWHILDGNDGSVLGSINAGAGISPHNTLVNLSGTHVYLGGLNNTYLLVADTATNQIIRRIGSLKAGVRPFTINGSETLAFTTATGFLGFQVSDIFSGKVLYTVPIKGFTASGPEDAPSHGISLSPDEKEVYVIDTPNSYVHVFDVSGLPGVAPKQVADIPLTKPMTGNQSPCAYSCQREGWIQHSRDGRFVYVGDAGDVIDTATRKSVINLPTLYNSREHLEIDWANALPVATTTRYGMGYVTKTGPTPTPFPSPTPGAIIGQDTFHRGNQIYWGTASDGHAWIEDAGNQSIFTISNNTGQISAGNGAYDAVLGPSTSNAEVLFSGSLGKFNISNIGAVLRWNDTINWYKAYIDGNNLIIQEKVRGAYTTLGSTPFAAQGGTSYTLRFRAVGSTLFAKVWQTGTTEPTNWMVTATNSDLQSGYCGVRLQVQPGITANVTSFLATAA
jgi:DNA-binding beta-propeller fold protein YncE